MKCVIAFILLLPFTALAQLSSENFQVDGYSVGSTQSVNATSENFETARETGGRFLLEPAEVEEVSRSGGILNRGDRSTTSTAFIDEIDVVVPDQAIEEIDGSDQSEEIDNGNGQTNTEGGGGASDGSFRTPVSEGVVDTSPSQTTHGSDSDSSYPGATLAGVEIKHFWLWWFLLLLLALYTARKLIYKNVDTHGSVK